MAVPAVRVLLVLTRVLGVELGRHALRMSAVRHVVVVVVVIVVPHGDRGVCLCELGGKLGYVDLFRDGCIDDGGFGHGWRLEGRVFDGSLGVE